MAGRPFAASARLAIPLAILFAAASLGNILLPAAYARETASWTAQGIGQDWVDLLLVAPVMLFAAILALRGSWRAGLVLGGAVAYTAYSLVLYAFAVHFNPLFLLYAMALGLSFYALVNIVVACACGDAAGGRLGVASLPGGASPRRALPPVPARGAARAAAVFSIVLGLMFYGLWLSEVIPAAASGVTPASLAEVGLITNPVQVLDIGIVLPAFIVGGVSLLRGRPLGGWLVPLMLAFGVLMDAALLGMDISMGSRGVAGGGQRIPIFAVMGAISLALLLALLRTRDRQAGD